MFDEKPRILCEACGRDLLSPPQGIFVLWRTFDDDQDSCSPSVVDVHWACKGHCDRLLCVRVRASHDQAVADVCEEIPYLCIPFVYLKWIMGHLNQLHNGDRWSNSAFEKFKTLAIAVYPHISRHATTAEQAYIDCYGRDTWLEQL